MPSAESRFEASDTWEHKGTLYSPGDRILLLDRRGTFFFQKHEKNLDLGTEWIWARWEGHFNIAVRPEKVKPPKPKKVRRKSVPTTIVVCPQHKKYTAVRKPRTDCRTCWDAYEERTK